MSELAPKRVAESLTTMTQYVQPPEANPMGTVFGGQMLAWIDLCAAIAAERHSEATVVTAGFDDVSFERPVRVGQIVLLESRVTAAFRTSVEVLVRVFGEDTRTRERWPTVEAFVTFVAVTADLKPKRVRPLLLETDEDRELSAAAEERRALRLARRKREVVPSARPGAPGKARV